MNVIEIEKSEDEYERMLNDVYGTVEVCGMIFDQGTALRKLDPVAFRCGLSDVPIRYQCGECENEYEDEDEAQECCQPEEE